MWDPLPSKVLSVLQSDIFGHPLLPNLKTLRLGHVRDDYIPLIPLFLSTRTTAVCLLFSEPNLHKITVVSMIATLPKLCPNLCEIHLSGLPRDPTIAVAVSELVLNTNYNTLRNFHVNSTLTEEARKVIYNHPYLRTLQTVVGRTTVLPTMVLPNLTNIHVGYHHGHNWLEGFRGASFGKLAMVSISPESNSIDNLLGAFETVALTTSIPATLSTFKFYTWHPWRPVYRSLLPFTQLENLVIEFSCQLGCSSTIDDDIVIDLAQAMPKLEFLQFGDRPCETPGGVTVKGLAALAHHCPRLFDLTIHFQVASLDPPELHLVSTEESTIRRGVCALRSLHAGQIHVPEESTLMVALTLLRIFPCLELIASPDAGWKKVSEAIYSSKQLALCSSKEYLFVIPWDTTDDTSPEPGAMCESDV